METHQWHFGTCHLYRMNCFDLLPFLDSKKFAIIADPPYGINLKTNWRTSKRGPQNFPPIYGDDKPFDPTPFLIVDPFMGSGSCAIAAQEGGYTFIGYEIERQYFLSTAHRLATFLWQVKVAAAQSQESKLPHQRSYAEA